MAPTVELHKPPDTPCSAGAQRAVPTDTGGCGIRHELDALPPGTAHPPGPPFSNWHYPATFTERGRAVVIPARPVGPSSRMVPSFDMQPEDGPLPLWPAREPVYRSGGALPRTPLQIPSRTPGHPAGEFAFPGRLIRLILRIPRHRNGIATFRLRLRFSRCRCRCGHTNRLRPQTRPHLPPSSIRHQHLFEVRARSLPKKTNLRMHRLHMVRSGTRCRRPSTVDQSC